MKKAQTWSLDLMIAILIFIVVIISFFYIINSSLQETDTDKLKQEAEFIPERLISSDTNNNQIYQGVNEESPGGNIIDDKYLNNLVEKSKTPEGYEEIRKELGIQGDFYIHFEDEEGNIIYIDDDNDIAGIGHEDVEIVDAGQ
ncbi:MAG: hypothetical protein PHV16_01195 [Candidatus Nanoarchaeia archaeon]|nr:hypothetical protein [Candidatus Nanoarchaeia archaeon]